MAVLSFDQGLRPGEAAQSKDQDRARIAAEISHALQDDPTQAPNDKQIVKILLTVVSESVYGANDPAEVMRDAQTRAAARMPH